ncbi:MAG: flagellar biosynthesis protein FliQ [Oscillospiraceae bacterium]|jgi:flagellar biosynthetic protein FliQ|nr:flagellar biosynthesis protein FliQ [Oscillospiraceae bacterium]
MTQEMVMDIFMEAMGLAFRLALPILLVAMLIGLTIAILQAATQVHEQTLTFAPKAITIALALLIAGPWMTSEIIDFMSYIFDKVANTPIR